MITQSHRASNYSMDEISLMPVDKVYKAMQTDAEDCNDKCHACTAKS